MAALHVLENPEQVEAAMHPLRRSILERLSVPGSATTVAQSLGIPRQKANYHLRELARVGLLVPAGEKRRRNCTERLYRTAAARFAISSRALGRPASSADKRSLAYVAELGERLVDDVATLLAAGETAQSACFSMETAIEFGDLGDRARFGRELTAAVVELIRRYHVEGGGGGRFRMVLAAHPETPPTIALAPQEDLS